MKQRFRKNTDLYIWLTAAIALLLIYLAPADALFSFEGFSLNPSHVIAIAFILGLLSIGHYKIISWESVSNYLVMFLIVLFLLSHFPASLMLSKTNTTGGDTGSDVYMEKYLIDYLLPHGKLIGWSPGTWLGYPMFQYQFVLPYLMMAFLSFGLGMEIAFKVITVLGVFTLPLFTYYAVKYFGFSFPTPMIAAIFSLTFLFQEKNTVFGGNIPSMLAGEFSYSISFSLMVLFLGVLYKSVNEGRFYVSASILYVLVALSHACTTITAALISLFFLVDPLFPKAGSLAHEEGKSFRKNLIILSKTYGLSFLLLAFFLLPMVFKLQYSTDYGGDWDFHSIFSWYQLPDAYIFHILAGLGVLFALITSYKRKTDKAFLASVILFLGWIATAVYQVFSGFNLLFSAAFILTGLFLSFSIDRKAGFLLFAFVISILAFFEGETLKTANVRFFPMMYFFAIMLAAYFIGEVSSRLSGKWVIPLIVVLGTAAWISGPFPSEDFKLNSPTTFIDGWIKWNYEGVEAKASWSEYKGIMDLVSGTPGRLHNDLSDDNNKFGTPRAFEATPYYSNKSTLEGVYAQASVSSPYVSYFQCEMSHHCAGIPRVEGEERTTAFNVDAGTKHAKILNVKTYVAVYDKLKEELSKNPEWQLIGTFGQHQVYNLTTISGNYVEVPPYEPVLVETSHWRGLSLEWYTNLGNIDVPLAFVDKASPADESRFSTKISDDMKAQRMLRESLLKPEFINSWLVCGPFPNPRDVQLKDENYWNASLDHGLETDYIGESNAAPDFDGACADKRWFSQLANSAGYLDLRLRIKPNEEVVAYSHTYVYSPVDQNVKLLYGSDDGIKIWLNNELIASDHSHRAAEKDSKNVGLPLKKGWNSILFKIEQVTGGWGFYARITDTQAKTVQGLAYQIEKPVNDQPPANVPETGLTRTPLDNDCVIQEEVSNEEVKFKTSCVGKPHIIKISYFPNWKVEGADKIYIVSPSYMLVYPSQENVRLYYGETPIDIIGSVLTIIGIVILGLYLTGSLDKINKKLGIRI